MVGRRDMLLEEFVHLSIGRLLEHDRRCGPEHVADAALVLWRDERRKFASDSKQKLALDAELAECAGWLLFHANRQTEVRAVLVESERLAGLAGNRPFQAFVLDLLSMHAVEIGNVGEAITIADELLSRLRLPPRIRIMAHVRKARAYAIVGETARALTEIERAKVSVLDSFTGRDPSWCGWIDQNQVAAHETEILTRVGRGDEALERVFRAARLADNQRHVLTSLVTKFGIYARLKAWREVENTTHEIEAILPQVTSALALARFRRLVRLVDRDAPEWLSLLVHEVAQR